MNNLFRISSGGLILAETCYVRVELCKLWIHGVMVERTRRAPVQPACCPGSLRQAFKDLSQWLGILQHSRNMLLL